MDILKAQSLAQQYEQATNQLKPLVKQYLEESGLISPKDYHDNAQLLVITPTSESIKWKILRYGEKDRGNSVFEQGSVGYIELSYFVQCSN